MVFIQDTIYQDGVIFAPDTRYISTNEMVDPHPHYQQQQQYYNGGVVHDDEEEDGDFIWDQTNDDSRDLDSGLVIIKDFLFISYCFSIILQFFYLAYSMYTDN